MTRLLVVLFLAFILPACQAMPPTEAAVDPAEAILPSETPLPAPTATLSPTLTPIPTAAMSPAELARRAGPVCEYASSALVETGPLRPPFAVMKLQTYVDAPSWEPSHQLPHLSSLSAADVQTVFCISETRSQTGTYADGSVAYQLFWEVWAISWPSGRVIGKKSFTGSPPPKTKAIASGSAEDSFPYAEFAAWVFHQVDHPDFIHFTEAVTAVAVSPDDDLVAFGTARANQMIDKEYQAKVFFFRTSDMQIISALNGHQGMVTSLAFSPDGNILASSGYDLFVKFWDVESSRLLGQVHLADTPNSLAFSPDGMKLAVASNLDIAFIDVRSMQVEHSLQEASGKHLAYAPDGSHVFVNSLGGIKIIDPVANMVLLAFPDPFALVPTLTVSADGSVAGVTYESPERVDGFSLSADGAQIVTYTMDRSLESNTGAENIRLATWDAKTGKYFSEVKFSGDLIRAVKFSPDGKRLAVGNGAEVWVWDTDSWQVKEKLLGHTGEVIDLAFTPDGAKVLSAGNDGTIRVWSISK